MSSKTEVKHTVQLRNVYCTGRMAKEKREYQVIDDQRNDRDVTRFTLCRNVPTLDDKKLGNIGFVQKNYEQVSCYINDVMSSIIIDPEKQDEFMLYSQMLEKIEQENARSQYWGNGYATTLYYLTYGYEYVKDGKLYQYSGFLNSYERDVAGFRETGSMFARHIGHLYMNIEGASATLIGSKHTSLTKKL